MSFRFPDSPGAATLRLQAYEPATGRVSDVRVTEQR